MYPVLLSFDTLTVHSYSVLLSFSFLMGGLLLVLLGARQGASIFKLAGLAVAIQIAAMVGSRALFVLNQGQDSLASASIISVGGLAQNGGIVLALLTVLVYVKLADLSFWSVTDWTAPALALGIFVARIGCFLAGCCYGKPTELPWAVEFPPQSPAVRAFGVAHSVHPTQLYESLAGLVILGLILVRRRRESFAGSAFLLLGIVYSTVRILNDALRGDTVGDCAWILTQTQVFTLLVGTVAATTYAVKSRRHIRRRCP